MDEQGNKGIKVNKGYPMEIIDISLVLAFLIFGYNVVEWKNKQDN